MRNKLFFLYILVLLALSKPLAAVVTDTNVVSCGLIPEPVADTIYMRAEQSEIDSLPEKKNGLKENKRKKLVAAITAFPFPFGFVGAHRVMLGTSPWVPVVYTATFGGCFGLIPLIDFFVIAFSKDISAYENNPHIFMWVK